MSPANLLLCAFALFLCALLMRSVGFNSITGEAADNLAKVVLEHAIMTDFCGIPLVSLRENSITELDLKNKGVGMPGAVVLSKLLPAATALTSLKCAASPECSLLCQHPLTQKRTLYVLAGSTKTNSDLRAALRS